MQTEHTDKIDIVMLPTFLKFNIFFVSFTLDYSGLNITKNSNLAYDLLKRIHHLSNDASISCYTLVHYDET